MTEREIGIPEGYTQTQNWTSEIVSLLNEIQWKPTQTIRAGFGQGVSLVTPVAVARYISAIANEGTVYEAHIVDKIVDQEGDVVKEVEPVVVNEIGDDSAEWDLGCDQSGHAGRCVVGGPRHGR